MPKPVYADYFDVSEGYFPQISVSTIEASPDCWKNTFPHGTFMDLLLKTERALSRQEMRSLWIEGAYGTGKSQCAYTLQQILKAPEEELRAYWAKYMPLAQKPDLLEKFLGHRGGGVLTVYRYASGSIRSTRDLCEAIQESVSKALVSKGLYAGEGTLKEGTIAWIEKEPNKAWFNAYLSQPRYSSMFSQSNADEVLGALRRGGEVGELMNNIAQLSKAEGVRALEIDADMLLAWLSDVIDKNNIKIVFIWDEFSDYFKNNKESLSDFQKLAELVNSKPFFLIPVTHEAGQMFSPEDQTFRKVRDRFTQINIVLPDNIAFDLIGHACSIKEAARENWEVLVDDLNSRIKDSCTAVMKEAGADSPKVIQNMLPLHPMAALVLKNIAQAFQSNQRSMFDFIKSSDTDDVRAFQWFIKDRGPRDGHPLLTVDLLWDFFYEKGKHDLSSEIRMILDVYPLTQGLRGDEGAVFRAVLILQAIDRRLGGNVKLLKATEQNICRVFEGIDGLEKECRGLAKGLKSKGILTTVPLDGGQEAYAAAVLAGDQSRINKHKGEVRAISTTAKLVADGGLSTALSLSSPLRLRFAKDIDTGSLETVTVEDFTKKFNQLKNNTGESWKSRAAIAFAKDDDEARTLRRKIREALSDPDTKDIIFIDTLSTPLGEEAFNRYVEHEAMAMYYQGNNQASSREQDEKAKRVLDQDWKNRIYNGQIIIYTQAKPEGEKLGTGQSVVPYLQGLVKNDDRFKYVFDFERGVTEAQFKRSDPVHAAKCGIKQNTSRVMVGAEKHLLPTVWNVEKYWKNPETSNLPISRIKNRIDEIVGKALSRGGLGQIAIEDIQSCLEKEFGFAPCNLSSFLMGFLLKEYAGEPYRYCDSSGRYEGMTPDKLGEMIGNLFSMGKAPKPTYIVKMTAEERAFYAITEVAWGLAANTCKSLNDALNHINNKIRGFGLPIWCLRHVDLQGVFDTLEKYIDLIKSEGRDIHATIHAIGEKALAESTLGTKLNALLNDKNMEDGMLAFLNSFENGKILNLAKDLGIDDKTVFADIRKLFSVKYSCLWDMEIGTEEIGKLLTEYGIIKESNAILNAFSRSKSDCYKAWHEHLNFFGVSNESLSSKNPALAHIFDVCLKIHQQADMLPEQLENFLKGLQCHHGELRELLRNGRRVFEDVYGPHLGDLSDGDIDQVRANCSTGAFSLSATEANSRVAEEADGYRKNQLKAQLQKLWREKTGTNNPLDWSRQHRTPILCCALEWKYDYDRAQRTFETLNKGAGSDSEIQSAMDFLNSTRLFEDLSKEGRREEAFIKHIMGEENQVLLNPERVRDALAKLPIEAYDWSSHPNAKAAVKELAKAEYMAGGIERVLSKIDGMGDAQLKEYLKRLVVENVAIGVEILNV